MIDKCNEKEKEKREKAAKEAQAAKDAAAAKLPARITSPATPAPNPALANKPSSPSVTLEGDLKELLERTGLTQEVGPILADQAIDTVELLRDFTLEDLKKMGIRAGHAMSLLKMIQQAPVGVAE